MTGDPAQTSAPAPTPATVLVVEDARINRQALRRGVEREGHHVLEATDGREALDRLRAATVDMVLLDLLMPDVDGFEVLATMGRDPQLRDVPVLVISAVEETEHVARAIEMGAIDCLPKPFDPVLLRVRLRTALEQARLRRMEQDYVRQEIALRQQERLATLGRLSAGLGHELNNPAAAALRTARQVASALDESEELLPVLVGQAGGAPLVGAVAALLEASGELSDAASRADRAENLEAALEALGVAEPWNAAEELAAMGLTAELLEAHLAGAGERADAAVSWVRARARRGLQATRPRPDAGLRLVGDRWSAASHRLREYLARNQVPFRWLDLDHPEAVPLLQAAGSEARLPLLLLEDGRALADPAPADVAEALRLSADPEVDFHDVVVVGAGPSGLAAAVYAASEGLGTLVVEAEAAGGQAGSSSRIENYLGFPSGVSGSELARRALAQARRFGTSIVAPRRAVAVRAADPYRVVELDDGTPLHCATVILATGVQYRRLEAPGVAELTGAGVYYGAASTEATAMSDGRVVVVGGANSAGQAALHLARFAAEVVMVVRVADLAARMSQYLVGRIDDTPNITVRTRSRVGAVGGAERLGEVRLVGSDGVEEVLEAAGMFVFIGAPAHGVVGGGGGHRSARIRRHGPRPAARPVGPRPRPVPARAQPARRLRRGGRARVLGQARRLGGRGGLRGRPVRP